jgi:hypothetical protein
MPGIQRAHFEDRSVPLSNEWGQRVAREKFGDDVLEAFPRFTRGPRKGQLKGYLRYLKVSVGGWAHRGGGSAGVLLPGTWDWKLAIESTQSDPYGHSVVACWAKETGVQPVQTPEEAAALYRAYKDRPRYF